MIHYSLPDYWIKYDKSAVADALVDARSVVMALQQIPYQRDWVNRLQQMELKREVAGTSRIEGAFFTNDEFRAAMKEGPKELETRSQRQAAAALLTYRWIGTIANEAPIDTDLIFQIHRQLVTNADDDHCIPAQLRKQDENVTFGAPAHRGADGGDECRRAFDGLVEAIRTVFKEHDPMVQAIAAHYHVAAMHPFLDGNGRTARALEALLLQRAGLRDTCFIAMSNYYYEEKTNYLAQLAAVRAAGFDLTPFLVFALKGVAAQAGRLLEEIRHEVSREIYRNLMFDLFDHMKSPRKRVLAKRQMGILKYLLRKDKWVSSELLYLVGQKHYDGLGTKQQSFRRDVNGLAVLGAIMWKPSDKPGVVLLTVDLTWPTKVTESGFLEHLRALPKARSIVEW